MINRLTFVSQAAQLPSDPNRTDIACFVGFVARRNTPLPTAILRSLVEQGWTNPLFERDAADLGSLLDVPVPIHSWNAFDALFAWEQRPYSDRLMGGTYLGAAVRSFFAQGGRQCYVVRVGDPWSGNTPRSQRLEQISSLIPGYPQRLDMSPLERRRWAGIGHLFGLPDVSYVVLPDLADAVGVEQTPPSLNDPEISPLPLEQFVECSQQEQPPPINLGVQAIAAPRCDEEGYRAWARAIHLVAALLNQSGRSVPFLREVQLVAAVPLPQPPLTMTGDLLEFLTQASNRPLSHALNDHPNGIASAFVQLVYPWVQTPGSRLLPEQLESPDAVLTGILARNALVSGCFRSAANLHLADVQRVFPTLSRAQQLTPHSASSNELAAHHALIERVSLMGLTPQGLRLLSDVTTSLEEGYRLASVNRLTNVILRTARRLGEAIVFDNSAEALWQQIRTVLNQLLLSLYDDGALRGKTAADAFEVRCDRTTMSQNDIDNGRTIATVQFEPSLAIERITVTLTMNEGGQLSAQVPYPMPQMMQRAIVG